MWRDDAWLLDILTAAGRVLEYAQGHDAASFLKDHRDQDAVLRQLTIIGEAAKRVSPDFCAAHREVPWKKIAGFRDVVVHDYFHVDLEEVWRIASDDVPELVRLVTPLIPPPKTS